MVRANAPIVSIEIRGMIRPMYVTQNSFFELVSLGIDTVKSAANATHPILGSAARVTQTYA